MRSTKKNSIGTANNSIYPFFFITGILTGTLHSRRQSQFPQNTPNIQSTNLLADVLVINERELRQTLIPGAGPASSGRRLSSSRPFLLGGGRRLHHAAPLWRWGSYDPQPTQCCDSRLALAERSRFLVGVGRRFCRGYGFVVQFLWRLIQVGRGPSSWRWGIMYLCILNVDRYQ